MKRILIAALVAGMPAAVQAADLNWTPPPVVSPPAPVSDGFNWSGVYIGGHGAYGFAALAGIHDGDDGTGGFDFASFKPDGWGGGGHIGYNHALGGYLFGIEGDFTAVDVSDSLTYTDFGGPSPHPMSAKVDYLYSVRGRVGHTWGSSMAFATAGAAWAHYEVEKFYTLTATTSKADFTDLGWVVGGGVEHAFHDHWLVRLEYLHYFFGKTHDLPGLSTDADPGDNVSLENLGMIRVGGSFKF